MGLTVRRYFFPKDGEPKRLSQRVADGLVFGSDAIPEYANSRQRVLTVYLENEDGKPVRITEADGSVWVFDDEGKIREGLLDALRHGMTLLPTPPDPNGNVLDLTARLSKKRLHETYRWEPSKADLDRIALDIWPDEETAPLKAATGKAPKRPPMTWDAKQALAAASQNFWQIHREIDNLKEPGLKAFAFEARGRANQEPENRFLYGAIADMAEQRLAVLRRRRKGSGVWYAVVELTHWNWDHSEGKSIATYFQQCDGKKNATNAARALLARHADSFSESITVEASLVTDLEWTAPSYGSAVEVVDGEEIRRW